jgi:hypothetical protein
VHDYSYSETNAAASPFVQPLYRIRSHFTPPLHAFLNQINETTIRQTMLSVIAQEATNGYALTAMHPIPYAWYLLLVRDRNNPQWRASGYFTSGTNDAPIYLRVDSKGMMHEGQSPIAMPDVKFLPDVVEPEFTAGWGEDSDGDGLPDIYEALVTHTDPANADTGNEGILDGYKDPDHDGWNNLEEFRRRTNPLEPNPPPTTVELKNPTLMEAMQATVVNTDLRYEPQVTIHKPGMSDFQPLDVPLQMYFYTIRPRDPLTTHLDFDVRVVWRLPQPRPRERGVYSGP